MAQTVVLPSGTYTGTQTIPSRSIPIGASRIELALDRTAWTDPAVTVTARLDLSFDDGLTWISPYMGFTAAGGIILIPVTGETLSITRVTVPLPQPNANRRIRGTIIIVGSLTTTGTLTID